MKGKKLNATQRKNLIRSGFKEDTSMYLLKKIYVKEDGKKRLSKDGNHIEVYVLTHKDTDSMIEHEIDP